MIVIPRKVTTSYHWSNCYPVFLPQDVIHRRESNELKRHCPQHKDKLNRKTEDYSRCSGDFQRFGNVIQDIAAKL